LTADGEAWDPLSPAAVAVLLGAFDGPWWVSGGVAVDLFVGADIRDHDTIEVAVFRDHWPAIAAALPGWDFREREHDIWARPHAEGPWEVAFVLQDRTGNDWQYDTNPEVTLPVTEVGMVTPEGVPYQRPEVVLLAEAAAQADHEADLVAALPKMGIGPRCWLAGALDLAHPGHPWIDRVL
jgi:hypothetical protein